MSLFGVPHSEHQFALLQRDDARAMIAQLRADLAASDAALVAERARYDALLQTVLAMKAKGADVVPVANTGYTSHSPHVPAPQAEPDELAALIDLQSGGDLRKRKMMLAQLKVDRAGGVSEDQIRASIVNGVQSDGVPT